MRLAASEINREIAEGTLVFDPSIEPTRIDASSVDLTLSNSFYVIEKTFEKQEIAGIIHTLDLRRYSWSEFASQFGNKTQVPENGYFDIEPDKLIIAYTKEVVTLPQHLGARVEGKSSYARIGLFVHITAPTIHPGFDNQIALEFYNVGPIPIRVHPGDVICQLVLEQIKGSGLYEGQFQKPSD